MLDASFLMDNFVDDSKKQMKFFYVKEPGTNIYLHRGSFLLLTLCTFHSQLFLHELSKTEQDGG